MVRTQEQKDRYNKARREKYAALSEDDKKKERAKVKAWADNHRGELKEYAKNYRQKNLETVREKDRVRRKKLKKERPILNLIREVRKRSKLMNIPCDIEESDIDLPTHCPILGIELSFNETQAKENSPSLDRIVPEKGYVKGNCYIISKRANRMKQDNTPETLRAILAYIEERLQDDE